MNNRPRSPALRALLSLPRTSLAVVAVALLLLAGTDAARAQDPFAAKTEPSAGEVLQNMLLGKMKEKQPTIGGTSSSTISSEHLPRKAPATAKPKDGDAKTEPATQTTTKPTRFRPVQRTADFPSLPRLQPARPISASPTIQIPQPTPMPIQ